METQVMNVCEIHHEERIFEDFTVYEWTMTTCNWEGEPNPQKVKFKMFQSYEHPIVWHPMTTKDFRTKQAIEETKGEVYANEPSTL